MCDKDKQLELDLPEKNDSKDRLDVNKGSDGKQGCQIVELEPVDQAGLVGKMILQRIQELPDIRGALTTEVILGIFEKHAVVLQNVAVQIYRHNPTELDSSAKAIIDLVAIIRKLSE